jgi:hypothetical protein
VLAGLQPHLQRAFAHLQAVYRLAIQAVAQAAIGNARPRGDARHEIVVALHRIGREIGEPQRIARRRVGDGQRAVGFGGIPMRFGAGPVLPISETQAR